VARMQKKYKVFIAVGILLNVILCLGIWANYKLDSIVASLNKPGVLYRDNYVQPGEPASSALPGTSAQSGGNASSNTSGTIAPSNASSPSGQTIQPSTQDIALGVEQKLGRPVEKKDLLEAGMIIMSKLNWDEITFLYNVGSKSKPSSEEIQQARAILKNKLSSDELATLKALGGKYGHGLNFLN